MPERVRHAPSGKCRYRRRHKYQLFAVKAFAFANRYTPATAPPPAPPPVVSFRRSREMTRQRQKKTAPRNITAWLTQKKNKGTARMHAAVTAVAHRMPSRPSHAVVVTTK